MAIPDHARTNFQTLLRAAEAGDLALMECLDAATREPRYVLAAVGRDGYDYLFTPFGHLAEGDPSRATCHPWRTAASPSQSESCARKGWPRRVERERPGGRPSRSPGSLP